MPQERTIYEAMGGHDAVVALAHAWHERVLAHPVVSHAFSHGFHPEHTKRLAAYWAEAWGGPAEFTGHLGDESRVVRMHSGEGEHVEMDRGSSECFALALDDAGIPQDARLRSSLLRYWEWALGTMNAYPDDAADVPSGLPPARWSWDGPVTSG